MAVRRSFYFSMSEVCHVAGIFVIFILHKMVVSGCTSQSACEVRYKMEVSWMRGGEVCPDFCGGILQELLRAQRESFFLKIRTRSLILDRVSVPCFSRKRHKLFRSMTGPSSFSIEALYYPRSDIFLTYLKAT